MVEGVSYIAVLIFIQVNNEQVVSIKVLLCLAVLHEKGHCSTDLHFYFVPFYCLLFEFILISIHSIFMKQQEY